MIQKISLWLGSNWLTIIAIGGICGALYYPNLPFAYFQLMNWAVVGASILIALHARNTSVVWLFLIVAVLFNPIAPIYLRADVWQIVDIIAIICLFGSFFVEEESH